MIILSVPSKIEYISRSITVDRGEDVFLNCSASGVPTPTVKWIHNNKVLVQTSSQANYTVRITNSSQAGQYVCTASNKYGTVSKSLDVFLRRMFIMFIYTINVIKIVQLNINFD